MGKLIYNSATVIDFDDRVLAHLEVVITAKLRRGEAFLMSWRDVKETGDGRTSVWLHPSIPLMYKYHGSRPPSINRAWIEVLSHAANTAGGLKLLPEPAETTGNAR